MILTLSRMVNAPARGGELVTSLQRGLDHIAEAASQFPRHPRVFFEEWMEPLISGIRFRVDELIEVAGGAPVFPELRTEHDARRRIVEPLEVAARNPEVIVASWCGKVNQESIRGREGWGNIDAVRNGQIYEIKSTYILQPGPAALTEGVRQLHLILARVCGHQGADAQDEG